MSEVIQQEQESNVAHSERGKPLPVRVSPTEIRYMTPKQLEESITQEDIQLGLDSAGVWSGLGVTEDEMLAKLREIRYGDDSSSTISPA